jgi:hypothetical protein
VKTKWEEFAVRALIRRGYSPEEAERCVQEAKKLKAFSPRRSQPKEHVEFRKKEKTPKS